jgi:hypothetical protein
MYCQILDYWEELIARNDSTAAKLKQRINNIKKSEPRMYLIWEIYKITDCFDENVINALVLSKDLSKVEP